MLSAKWRPFCVGLSVSLSGNGIWCWVPPTSQYLHSWYTNMSFLSMRILPANPFSSKYMCWTCHIWNTFTLSMPHKETNLTMFVTNIPNCTHVHISVTKWCSVGYGTSALWDSNVQRVYSNYSIDGLMQDCGISSALAMEILQSCTMPLIWDNGLEKCWGRSITWTTPLKR